MNIVLFLFPFFFYSVRHSVDVAGSFFIGTSNDFKVTSTPLGTTYFVFLLQDMDVNRDSAAL